MKKIILIHFLVWSEEVLFRAPIYINAFNKMEINLLFNVSDSCFFEEKIICSVDFIYIELLTRII